MTSSRTAPACPQPLRASSASVLLELLAPLPDPRSRRGIRHGLPGILAVAVAAVLTGAKSFAAIGQWVADADPDLLAALGSGRKRGPSETAIRRAFARLDAATLDGKTIRGARTKDATGATIKAAPHLVAAHQ